VYLQQDAFDKVDASTSLNRQKAAMALLTRIVDAPLSLSGKQDIRDVFTRLTDLFRNLNYAEFENDNYWKIRHSIDELLKQYAREASRMAAP
jgi:V/A-type H+-transporting ATPase subunit A